MMKNKVTPAQVLGGEFWLYMNWLQLVASALICILSSINLLKTKKI